MWCITLIDFHMLYHPCILGINPTGSWCLILLMCCWIWLACILLMTFALIFVSDISLWFYFHVVVTALSLLIYLECVPLNPLSLQCTLSVAFFSILFSVSSVFLPLSPIMTQGMLILSWTPYCATLILFSLPGTGSGFSMWINYK